MSKNNIISVYCFGLEIGRVGLDENTMKSFFQYNPVFLKDNYFNIFPNKQLVKDIPNTQVFSSYNNETFKGLPPFIADSLPDVFGNLIFKTWLESTNKTLKQISSLEQLAYVSNRGMGALEFQPSKDIPTNSSIKIDEITALVNEILDFKKDLKAKSLNAEGLMNVFKIGTSAGGARPKILIAENKNTGEIIPGDVVTTDDFNHYLVKLAINEDNYNPYPKEVIEYAYYQHAKILGIEMMDSKLIEDKHFCTKRFDRQNGEKQHILTSSGLTGWDFKDPHVSTYENLFELAAYLKIQPREMEQLYKRMVFNVVFCNADDHLKNHSFIFHQNTNEWKLAPAYDITYPFNPNISYKRKIRALSINNKRTDINKQDLLNIADKFTIKHAKNIIADTVNSIETLNNTMKEYSTQQSIIETISKDFVYL